MGFATSGDGVRLYYEEAGSGSAIIFVHEFAGDHRSWEPQMRYFARRYRCVTYGARGYPPSDIPEDVEMYSQVHAAEDILAVMDHLGIDRAHIVGLSMGGMAALHFGLRHPERATSLVAAGAGYGSEPGTEEEFRTESIGFADRYLAEGSEAFAETYGTSPVRVQMRAKDPRGWQEFYKVLAEHSPLGASNTMRGYQARRPSLYTLEDEFRRMDVPTLVVNGDEDDRCLEPGLFLKRTIPACGLLVLPKTGHIINLEEPMAFNQAVAEFFAQVEAGKWGPRPAAGN